MTRRQSVAPQRVPGMPVDYQCVRLEDDWHATQEQASPPAVHLGGAWTICALWAPFTRGYERRRPECPVCLRAVERDEGIYVEPVPAPTTRSTAKKVAPTLAPAVLQTNATAAADLDQRLQALVESTRKGR